MIQSIQQFIFTKRELPLQKIATIYYVAFLFFWLIRFFNNLWLFQLGNAPVFYIGNDLSFALLDALHINTLNQHFLIRLTIDITLVLLAAYNVTNKKKTYTNVVFSIVLLLYIFLHYGSLGAHKHNLTGLWFASLLFWFPTSSINATLMFKFIRLYGIYAYASAGFWKIYRYAFSADFYFNTILKSHNALFMFENPQHIKTRLIEFLLNHASLSDMLFQAMTLGEFIFIIALFTVKFDRLLVFFALAFHTVSYLLVNVYFYEFTLILLPFWFALKGSKNFSIFTTNKQLAPSYLIISFITLVQVYYFAVGIAVVKNENYNRNFYGAYPFQNYMMYSYAYHSDTFDDYKIYIDGKLQIQHRWLPIKTEQFEGNVLQYENIKESNGIYTKKKDLKNQAIFSSLNPEIDLKHYENWIQFTLTKLCNAPANSIELKKATFKFEDNNVIQIQENPVFN